MKIPATIITGFLGAGKTTLIRHLLENANGKRIALVINEFGELGIDREMITGCGIKGCDDNAVLELANGCICCTVADDFLPTMETLLHRVEPPDHIVIETSGLALPKPLVRAFNWPEIRSQVTVDGVIAVVDSLAVSEGRFASDPDAVQQAREADAALDHDAPLEEVFEDQLLCADMVLLNKCDLLDSERLESVLRDLDNNTAAAVRIVATSHGAIDPLVLLGIGAAVEHVIEGRRSHHDGEEEHDHDDFESFIIDLGVVDDPEVLEARIRAAAVSHDILRVKGFVDIRGKDMRHVVQAVGQRIERYYDRPWAAGESRRSELVVIGEAGLDRASIAAAIGAKN